jgi:hypothetical protein
MRRFIRCVLKPLNLWVALVANGLAWAQAFAPSGSALVSTCAVV